MNKKLLSLAAMLVAVAAHAQTQSWTYQPYLANGSPADAGRITVVEKGEDSTLQFFAGNMNLCYQGALKAAVERRDNILVVTPVPRMHGCDEIRFTLQTDGTPGTREYKQNGQWVVDKHDRKLTIEK